MRVEPFEMERLQSLWENRVEYNLSESGVHPMSLREVLGDDISLEEFLDQKLGYGQTNGSPQLQESIAELYPSADAENVLVTNGAAEANFLAVCSRIEPGDEIIVMLPNYMQIWGLARALGAQIVPLPLREQHRWAPDLGQLARAFSRRTRLIAVCNPNNPTGAVPPNMKCRPSRTPHGKPGRGSWRMRCIGAPSERAPSRPASGAGTRRF
ncbi:MAG TPA: aminotransferase class I/II-fold pyridoxal phosphate-dependent enzyme [Bryobacterales bacterium]|nr:aminotransferase class I/II-fold pyridoxal phosphate-dependent enzyme [Bryobacterales bacterium]